MDNDKPFAGFPHMEPPEVEPPRKTIPGSIGCLLVFLGGLALIALAVAHFYSLSNYSTELNVDGTYHFSGALIKVNKVLLADRYKLVIASENDERLVLPPLPSMEERGEQVLPNLKAGLCVDGDITIKSGFLHDLSLSLGERTYHFDSDAGWLLTVPEAATEAPAEEAQTPAPASTETPSPTPKAEAPDTTP